MIKKEKHVVTVILLLLCAVLVAFGTAQYAIFPFFDTEAEDSAEADTNIFLYSDVRETDWFFEDVRYVSQKGMMNGTGNDSFSPHVPTTRGMLVTILWRLENEPDADAKVTFIDVAKDAFYSPAVCWAVENGIVSGYSETYFGPDDSASREQMVAILFRYAAYKGYDCKASFDLSVFADSDEISGYATDAVKWACYNEILTGTTENAVSPKDNTERCQVAAVIHRMCENLFPRSETGEAVVKEEALAEAALDTAEATPAVNRSKARTYKGNSSSVKSEELPEIKEEESGEKRETEENTSPETASPSITIKTAKAKAGETVIVEAELQNNPGILGMILRVEYDESALQLLRAGSGEALAGILTFTPSKNLQSGAKLAWDGLDLRPEDAKDGIFLELEFAVAEDAEPGTHYPIALKYNAGDVVDYELKEIKPKINYGYIAVE